MKEFNRQVSRDLNSWVKGLNLNDSLGNFLMMMLKGGSKNIF